VIDKKNLKDKYYKKDSNKKSMVLSLPSGKTNKYKVLTLSSSRISVCSKKGAKCFERFSVAKKREN
jgi:hypothetical protein